MTERRGIPTPPLTPGNWRITCHPDGSVEIFDPAGNQRARFAGLQYLAEHMAMALEQMDRLAAKVVDLELLLMRKSNALDVFASPPLWDQPRTGEYVWQGDNVYLNPMAFAAKERDADEPTD